MYEFDLPYDHKTMHLSLDEKNFAGLMQGHQNEFKPSESQQKLVEDSLDNPYGSPSSRSSALARRTSSSSAPTTRAPFPRA